MKKISKLTPFGRFCCTIGNLPTSYMESLTYEQQLLWLCKYLEETVIPAVNNNGEAVEELQTLYTQLKNYVDTYFENLDVQEEINNKLDAMAEDGTLNEIITNYLKVAGLLCFNTKNDLKNASNIIENSFTKTFGTTSYNDGYGHFYKIRKLINTDIIDDNKLLTLYNYPTLVAEKIEDKVLNDLQQQVYYMNNKKYLFIGDSYATGYQGAGVEKIEGYFNKVIRKYNLNAQIIASEGYGLCGLGNNLKWLNLIQNSTINNKDSFTDIIICGGMNDKDYIANIPSAMSTLVNYLKQNFINATIHFGSVGRFKQNSNDQQLLRLREVFKAYHKYAILNNCKFIENSNLILHNPNWFIDDNIHPNSLGENQLAYAIEQYIINNKINDLMAVDSTLDYHIDTVMPSDNISLNAFQMYSYIDNNNTGVLFAGTIIFDNNLTIDHNTDIIIGKITDSYLGASPYTQGLNLYTNLLLKINGSINSSDYCKVDVRLYNDKENNLHLKFNTNLETGGKLQQLTGLRVSFYDLVSTLVDSRNC